MSKTWLSYLGALEEPYLAIRTEELKWPYGDDESWAAEFRDELSSLDDPESARFRNELVTALWHGGRVDTEDIEFAGAGVVLSGTAAFPGAAEACPGVVLVGGSGPADRHNDGFFDALWGHLTAAGGRGSGLRQTGRRRFRRRLGHSHRQRPGRRRRRGRRRPPSTSPGRSRHGRRAGPQRRRVGWAAPVRPAAHRAASDLQFLPVGVIPRI